MKQETAPTSPATATTSSRAENKPSCSAISVSTSTVPSRLGSSSSKAQESLKPPETPTSCVNGSGLSISSSISPSSKARAKSVPRDTNLHNNNQRARRPLLGNRPKSGDDVPVVANPSSSSSQKAKLFVSDEVKAIRRLGSRPVVEQFSWPRRQRPVGQPISHSASTKKNEGDRHHHLNEKETKELRQKLNQNETLITNLQSEVLELKAELDKARSFNVELQSRNHKLSEDLATAQSQIATLSTHDQRGSVVDCHQSPKFKDIQKLIANKLEHGKVKNHVVNDATTAGSPMIASKEPLVISSVDVHRNITACPMRPPPPPPPPPPKGPAKAAIMPKSSPLEKSHHSLIKSERPKYSPGSGHHDKPISMSAHSSIVGEIQKRSLHLLAIKSDIETKGEFINGLIQKVQDASYTKIEDVLEFVNWLDIELSTLADERAVLKHFNWPEKKADAMREAAVEYRSLKFLESEISSYKDDAGSPPGISLKNMAGLLDKSEKSIQQLIKLRSSAMLSYQHLKIPTDWMLETGIINRIKQASVMLANIYMKRVTIELESIPYSERECAQGGLLLQGIHFAYRAYQFAGGLDSETLYAFEDIRKHVPGHLRCYQELFAGIPLS
ncbi:hypothetical protein NMG60_11033063 [Bertholletia excelsa]